MSALLNEDDLRNWTGFKQRGQIESWLRQNKIAFTHGKGNKLMTTQEAVDRALLGERAANDKKDETFF